MPWLDWIQIEITSRCNAACIYCPRTVYSSDWINRELPWDTFMSLAPIFAKTKMVHLQGWGEPLLHQRFFDMVSTAKRAGAQVGTTSNGMLLNDQNIDRLIASGIDTVALSLAGTEEKNDRIRSGTQIRKVLQAAAQLHLRKTALRTDSPKVNVAYLLLRSQLADIEGIIPMFQGKGLNNIIISTLDFVPGPELEGESLIPRTESEYNEIKLILDRLVRDGERAGLSIHYQLASPEPQVPGCPENVERALFISADGSVSPCAFTNIPASGLYWREGKGCAYNRMLFGSIKDSSVPVIWLSRRYSEFRNSFTASPEAFCRTCPKYFLKG